MRATTSAPTRQDIKLPSCANRFVTLLVLRLACLSDVKVVFWHVSERHNLQVSVSGCKLVT